MDEERYTMAEAAEVLGVSNKTLVNWVNIGGLREAVEAQTFEYDKRAHYLTREQLEKIARDHRRTLKGGEPAPTRSGPPMIMIDPNRLTPEEAELWRRLNELLRSNE